MSLGLVLTIIFTVLKLTGYIDWSWFQVMIPVIIELVVTFLVVIFVFVTGRKVF